jgi:Zn finger protein HypA/HybF involved in hydrogenase expression
MMCMGCVWGDRGPDFRKPRFLTSKAGKALRDDRMPVLSSDTIKDGAGVNINIGVPVYCRWCDTQNIMDTMLGYVICPDCDKPMEMTDGRR